MEMMPFSTGMFCGVSLFIEEIIILGHTK